jgi:hypothetical protein
LIQRFVFFFGKGKIFIFFKQINNFAAIAREAKSFIADNNGNIF